MCEKSETKYIITDEGYDFTDHPRIHRFSTEAELIEALTKDFSTRLNSINIYKVEKLTPEITVSLK